MTYGELKRRAAYLVGALAGYKTATPAPDWGGLINEAYTQFAFDTEFNQTETTFVTVANQAEYSLSEPYWKHLDAVLYSTTTRLLPTSEAEEAERDPLWLLRSAGTPTRYCIPRPGVIRLVDKPSAGDVTITLRGVRSVSALTSDSSSPAFYEVWHDALASYAAWFHAKPWARGEDAEVVATYYADYQRSVKACKAVMGQQRWGAIERRVATPARPRVSAGFGRI